MEPPAIALHKVMVIDKAIVFNACINFTKQAEGKNCD